MVAVHSKDKDIPDFAEYVARVEGLSAQPVWGINFTEESRHRPPIPKAFNRRMGNGSQIYPQQASRRLSVVTLPNFVMP